MTSAGDVNEVHPNLRQAVGMVEGLASTFGPRSEVLVHDLSLIPNSIIAISGGLTGRAVGGSMTDMLLARVRSGDFEDLLNYMTAMDDGRTFRSSTLFIRDGDEVLGCMSIHQDVTEWRHLSAFAEWQLSGTGVRARDLPTLLTEDGVSAERFPPDVEALRSELISRAIADIGVSIELLHKRHKLAIVQRLEREGFFMLRDAVPQLASALSVTRHSVYNYLNEARAESAANESS
ncbi:MAG TPA: PAS domain-containing protein [Novosphingobium sp.]|nr:PAS domain-containing protein [Novosphingobium sp.]HZV08845.1 PAS domain-containing protein [Novosphingobium sp.]